LLAGQTDTIFADADDAIWLAHTLVEAAAHMTPGGDTETMLETMLDNHRAGMHPDLLATAMTMVRKFAPEEAVLCTMVSTDEGEYCFGSLVYSDSTGETVLVLADESDFVPELEAMGESMSDACDWEDKFRTVYADLDRTTTDREFDYTFDLTVQ
jgi:hypothetical protein